jgi:predicted metal-dependent hydrolase
MTEPDPKTVREIAQEIIAKQARYWNALEIREDYRADPRCARLSNEDFIDLRDAVIDAIASAVVTVSWPDEQPAAEQDGDALAAELVSTKDALNAAYRERAHLLALIAAQYRSHIGHTDPAAPDWAVVTIELPTGQACWHISAADEELFQHVDQEPARAIAWDGHSTEEKYRHIDELTQHVYGQQFDEQVY